MNRSASTRRGLTLHEVLATAVAFVLTAAVLSPTFAAMRGDDDEIVSANNLRMLGQMHVSYAADWDGRQWTVTSDDLSDRIGNSYRNSYSRDEVPPAVLGFDCNGVHYETSVHWALVPMWYPVNCSLGNFRGWNTNQFNQYANGKVYDRMFWAPRDPTIERGNLEEFFKLDCQWPGGGTAFYYPTYCMSVAAQVAPECYRGPQDGGSQRPLSLPDGHRTPNLAQARYPDLKTHMLEHYWLNPPPYRPDIPNTGGVPWYFNMSHTSEPIGLLFDGSVRKVPVMESLVSNDIVVRQGGDPLWADDPGCFGDRGYFENYQATPFSTTLEHSILVDQTTSYHVFTRDGILGRDTLFSGGR